MESHGRGGERRSGTARSGAPIGRRNGPFDPSTLGRAAHEVIATLCAEGLRGTDYERVARTCRSHPATSQPTVRRQAAVGWLCSAASMYFRLFAPPEGWEFLGSEVRANGCCFDLVWRNRFAKSVIADELKTGKAADLIEGARLDDQVSRELAGGCALYGKSFVGVRVLILAAPKRSFTTLPGGTRTPFFEESR